MASFDEVKLEDILHCSFATFNPDTGANKDADSLPTAVVYEEGSSTALVSTVTVTNITTGRYRLQVTIAAADGYEAGKYYELWVSATVTGTGSPVTQSAPLVSFKATARVVDDLATPTNITAGTITTCTTNTDMRGTDNAALASALATAQADLDIITGASGVNLLAATQASIDAIEVDTNDLQTNQGAWATATGFATPTNITAATGITVSSIGANVVNASALAADAVTEIQSGLATAANLLIVSDGVGFITSVLLGTISDAGTAGETYVVTFGGATYTLDYTGLDATGNRTGVTRTKV